jgi:hypothetical protein
VLAVEKLRQVQVGAVGELCPLLAEGHELFVLVLVLPIVLPGHGAHLSTPVHRTGHDDRRGEFQREGTHMKKLSYELTYPGATVDQVAEMLGDPAFRQAVCDAQHVLRSNISVFPQGDSKVVEMEQVQATKGVPGFARKLVGDETTIVSTETWSSPTDADLAVAIPGKPGKMQGTIRVAQVGADVVETVDLAITVSVPLVGGKIEGLLSDLMTAALKKENEVGRDWLAR